MTTTDFTDFKPVHRPVESAVGQLGARLKRAWSAYRTSRILAGLDEATLKDIGAPRPGGAAAAADRRVIDFLETLR